MEKHPQTGAGTFPIVTYRGCVTYRRGLEWMIGCTDTLYLRCFCIQYSVAAGPHGIPLVTVMSLL